MKIALVQMDIALGDVAANQAKIRELIGEGCRRGARLAVLPELWSTGYQLPEIRNLAEPEEGPSLGLLKGLAREHRVEIVAGSMAETDGAQVYNTAYVIGPDGAVRAKYRKIHLIGLMDEDRYLRPGHRKCLFDSAAGPAGIIICYDLRFTELPRAMALAGCRVLFVPAEWPSVRGRHWLTLNIARAIENQLFVIAVNRVGRDRSNEFYGHSLVVDPWGEVVAEGSDREEVLVVDVDFAAGEEMRRRMPVFADRRPECY
ncbi:MAG TPA: carbon-nitrogen family hydrolase [Selenomonadales bacterium]|nr:carbon-nitrogen family hydrolase [Selenomonadales bacterium]